MKFTHTLLTSLSTPSTPINILKIWGSGRTNRLWSYTRPFPIQIKKFWFMRLTPINDYDMWLPYSSCRTCLTNCMGSISCHIMPLVISSLGGRHAHTHTDVCTETTLRNQACAWFINYQCFHQLFLRIAICSILT